MTDRHSILLRAIKCLRFQNEESAPDAPWLRFNCAYIVGNEVYLAKGAAILAGKASGHPVEELKYADACKLYNELKAEENNERNED